MRRIPLLVVVLAAALSAPSTVHAACLCRMISSPGEVKVRRSWSERDRIFIGEVLDADTLTGGTRKSAQFVTLASWRGAMPDTVTLLIGEDAGCVHYRAGERYFVYADLASPDATTLVTAQCDGSWRADQPAALRKIAELGPAPWRAPPMGSRKLDAVAIRIGERAPRDSSQADIVLGVSVHLPDSMSRFQIADREYPRDRTSLFYLPPGLYQFRVTWKDGTSYASYVSLRCGPRPTGERCQVFRSFPKPKEAACPPREAAPYLPCQVDSRPALRPGRSIPRFPETLLKQQASGSVRVRYTVDTAGRADMSTMAVIQATHKLFGISVRNALPTSRFTPGMLGGHKVPVILEEVFAFDFRPGADLFPIREVHDTLPDGVPRTTISGPPRDSSDAAAMSAEDLVKAQWSAIERVIPSREVLGAHRSSPSTPTVCVHALRAGEAPELHAAHLRRMSSLTLKVVDVNECPRTYASMQVVLDSLRRPVDPRPPGWVDPHVVHVTVANPWSGDAVLIEADVRRGMGGSTYYCGAERVGDQWQATCRNVVSFVH